jgi:hypothetical protein
MTPRNYINEELLREIERCYTDELVLEMVRRMREILLEISDDDGE